VVLEEKNLQKTDYFPCKERQVGVVPADGQGCLQLIFLFFVIIEVGSLAMSAGANPTIYVPI
jgi:hypothetical protein